jgi:hypothetical protein
MQKNPFDDEHLKLKIIFLDEFGSIRIDPKTPITDAEFQALEATFTMDSWICEVKAIREAHCGYLPTDWEERVLPLLYAQPWYKDCRCGASISHLTLQRT